MSNPATKVRPRIKAVVGLCAWNEVVLGCRRLKRFLKVPTFFVCQGTKMNNFGLTKKEI